MTATRTKAGLSEQQLYIFIFLFRIINALCIQTFFNPDEYWQSLEVSHFDVFGYGYKTWEWSPDWKLRSYSYPLLFSFMFNLFKLLGIDHANLLINAPKLLHGIGTAITDIMVYRCANNWFGPMPANFALLCSLLNWFIFYALSRTFTNCVETYFCMIAMYFWPFPNAITSVFSAQHVRRRKYALIFASIACMFRVTNAIVWVPLIARELLLLYQVSATELLPAFIYDILLVATSSITALIAIDSVYYGELTVTPYNFYYFNNVLRGSALYGTHPFYWYFVVGIPTVVGTMLPSIFSALQFLSTSWHKHSTKKKNYFALISKLMPLVCCIWTTLVFSCNAHKEFRFLLPILPLLMVYCGLGLYQLSITHPKVSKYVLLLLMITNGGAGLYLSQYHQSAPIAVMKFLYQDIYKRVNAPASATAYKYSDIDVDFILPCHATPFFSYLHLGDQHDHLELRFLECAPHFDDNGELTRAETPSWYLETNPSRYFTQHLPRSYSQHGCPKYVVIASHHLEIAQAIIGQCGYISSAKFSDNYLLNNFLVVLSNGTKA